MITSVNEDARGHAIELLQQEIDDEANRREGDTESRIGVREQALEFELSEIETRKKNELTAADEELAAEIDAVMGEARELEEDLKGSRRREAARQAHAARRDRRDARRGDSRRTR